MLKTYTKNGMRAMLAAALMLGAARFGHADVGGTSLRYVSTVSTGSLGFAWNQSPSGASAALVVLSTNNFATVNSSQTLAALQNGVTYFNPANGVIVSTSILANTTYFFEVKLSTESDAFYQTLTTGTPAAIPSIVPAGLLAFPAAASTGAVTVNWSSGSVAGGYNPLSVTSYTVVLSTSSGVPNFSGTSSGNIGANNVYLSTIVPLGSVPTALVSNGAAGVNGTLFPNTTYFVFVGALGFDFRSYNSTFQLVGTTATAPATPAVAPSGVPFPLTVQPGFLSVSWASGTAAGGYNPITAVAASSYTVILSTVNPLVLSNNNITLTTAPTNAQPTASFTQAGGLTANTTYFAFVAAKGYNSALTSFILAGTTVTPAANPVVQAVLPVSSTKIQAFWTGGLGGVSGVNATGTNYTVVASTWNGLPPTNNSSSNVSLTTTSVTGGTFSGLAANTTYFVFVNAVSLTVSSSTPFILIGTTATLAAVPTAVSALTISSANLQVNWNANGNVANTTYTVVMATNPAASAQYSVLFTTTPVGVTPQATMFSVPPTAGSYNPSTVYYPFVLATNVSGVQTVYAGGGAFGATAPTPPAGAASTFTLVNATSMQVVWASGTNTTGFNSALTTYTIVLSTWNGLPPVNNSASNVTFSTSPTGIVPSATVSGLQPNTTYWINFAATNVTNSSTTMYVQEGSTNTLAAVPVATATLGGTIANPTMVLSWAGASTSLDAAGNPAGTTYFAQISTDNFATPAGLVGIVTTTNTSVFFGGLAPGRNYFTSVIARNSNNIQTAVGTAGLIATQGNGTAVIPAVSTSGVTYPDVQVSSITVQWSAGNNLSAGTTYQVFMSSVSNFATINASSVNVFNISAVFGSAAYTGPANGANQLLNNTQYYFQVQSTGPAGGSSFLNLGSVFTRASTPTFTSVTNISSTSATYNWFRGGNNPSYTIASIDRSSASTFNAVITTQVAGVASFTDTSLIGCTTYFIRIKNINGNGLSTLYDGVLTNSFSTTATTPTAPGGFTATPQAGNIVTLAWNGSVTEGVTAYKIYSDSGTGAAISTGSATSLVATISTPTTTSFTTGAQPAGLITYRITAVHRCGVEESVGTVATAQSVATVSAVRANIVNPTAGAQIINTSNNLTLTANVTGGTASSVVFQFKDNAASAYTVLSTQTSPSNGTNFSYVWDLTKANSLGGQLPNGTYNLQAVAYDVNNASDSIAVPITITVVSAGTPGAAGEVMSGGVVTLTSPVSPAIATTLTTSGGAGSIPETLAIQPGTFVDALGNAVAATVSFSPNPTLASGLPLLPAAINPLGSVAGIPNMVAKILVTNALGVVIQPVRPETITFGYTDKTRPGAVDGTTTRVDAAKGFSNKSDTVPGSPWVQDVATTVDLNKKTISGQLLHNSFVQFAGVAASTLGGVRVYPNPYKPNSGNLDQGTPLVAGQGNTGIVFDQLPTNVTVKIYTITGSLVTQFSTTNGSGVLQWDGRNSAGRNVASGGYLAVFTSPGQKSVVKTLAIIR